MEEKKKDSHLLTKLLCVISDILKQWKIILCVASLCGIGLDAYRSFTYEPVYGASILVALSDGDDIALDIDSTMKAKVILQHFFDGAYMKNMVNKELNQNSFDGSIYITQMSNTNFCTIQVQSSSQKAAFFQLDTLIDAYSEAEARYNYGYRLTKVENIKFTNYPLGVNSHKYNYITGFSVAFCLMVGAYAMYYFFRDTIKSAREINDKVDLKLYVKIPKEFKRYQKFSLIKKKTSILVSRFKTGFAYVEAMNKLASKVDSSAKKHGYKTILVTSSIENEGKSSVAVNLAISLAKNKNKVLLIDGDLRKPSLHKILETSFDYSMVDLLSGKRAIRDCIVHMEKEHIDVIFSQKSKRSQELLSHTNLAVLLKNMKGEYDYIIVDSAPARYLNDTSYIGSVCDATLLVIKQDFATCRVINDTIYQLGNMDANLIGCIFNESIYDVFKGSSMYGYRYGYYHRYYSKERRVQ